MLYKNCMCRIERLTSTEMTSDIIQALIGSRFMIQCNYTRVERGPVALKLQLYVRWLAYSTNLTTLDQVWWLLFTRSVQVGKLQITFGQKTHPPVTWTYTYGHKLHRIIIKEVREFHHFDLQPDLRETLWHRGRHILWERTCFWAGDPSQNISCTYE